VVHTEEITPQATGEILMANFFLPFPGDFVLFPVQGLLPGRRTVVYDIHMQCRLGHKKGQLHGCEPCVGNVKRVPIGPQRPRARAGYKQHTECDYYGTFLCKWSWEELGCWRCLDTPWPRRDMPVGVGRHCLPRVMSTQPVPKSLK